MIACPIKCWNSVIHRKVRLDKQAIKTILALNLNFHMARLLTCDQILELLLISGPGQGVSFDELSVMTTLRLETFSKSFLPLILKYHKVASRSMCYYSGNQVFGGATNRDMSLNETCFYS